MPNDNFNFAQAIRDWIEPKEPEIIGRCVYCEYDIYKCEEEDTYYLENGNLAHFECWLEQKENEIESEE